MTIRDTREMIAGMAPQLQPGRWVYCSTGDDTLTTKALPEAMAVIREAEGITFILPEHAARQLGFPTDLVQRQITLNVLSDLEGIGLTAAISGALKTERISCNVVAAFHHDHVFVPEKDADRAVATLLRAQSAAQEER